MSHRLKSRGVLLLLTAVAMKGKDADMTLEAVPSWTAASLSLLLSATYK